MCRYIFAYDLEEEEGGEVFLKFSSFPEIISSVGKDDISSENMGDVEEHAHDAVIAALQAIIVMREDVPRCDDPNVIRADGFVRLSVGESMKLELAKIYRSNCKSVAELARILGKSETAARRLLDLRHRSTSREIENAIRAFGKRLVHDWSLEEDQAA